MSHSLVAPEYAPFSRPSAKNPVKALYVQRVISGKRSQLSSGVPFKTQKDKAIKLMSQRNRALKHARNQIEDKGIVDSRYGRRLIDMLEDVLVDTSAYATISLDEDGFAYAEWRAGRSYISIEVDDSGTSFTSADMNGQLLQNRHVRAISSGFIRTAKESLAKFTADLDAVNSNWRTYF